MTINSLLLNRRYITSFLIVVIFLLQSCGGGSGGGGTAPFTDDITPDSVNFRAIPDVSLNSLTVSETITISGINAAAPVSVIGGEYAIDGGSFTNNNGSISNGQTVQVRQTSSNAISSTTDVSLTIGTVNSIFSITTVSSFTGMTIVPEIFTVSENTGTQILKVTLFAQPTGTVIYNLESSDQAKIAINKNQLQFTVNNWNIPQEVIATGIDNSIASGDAGASILLSYDSTSTDSSGFKFQNLSNLAVTLTDDDTADILISSANDPATIITTLGKLNETGPASKVQVILKSEPLTDITLTVSSSLQTDATVSTANTNNTLVFKAATSSSTSDWDTPQVVTITPVNDNQFDSDSVVTISINVTFGDNTGYEATLNKKITATIINVHVADSKEFLQFLNKTAPRNNELSGNRLAAQFDTTTKPATKIQKLPNGVVVPRQQIADAGLAYYAAVDPNNKRLTLSDFKSFNNLQDGVGADGLVNRAVYVNDADLGFGRRMYVSVNVDATTNRTLSVASCVENYAPYIQNPKFPNDPAKLIPNINASPSEKIAKANAGIRTSDVLNSGFIATVCMEYSGTPGTLGTGTTSVALKGRKFVKFFSYGATVPGSPANSPLDGRITEANLDGDGMKTQPGVCNTCHGGQGNSLNENGGYPLFGDTAAQFLPWDINTFLFADGTNVVPASLQAIFKRFNEAVLATYPKAQTFSLLETSATTPLLSVAPGASGSSFITVPTLAIDPVRAIPEITSIIVSVDSDFSGTGPGITNIGGEQISLTIIDPARSLTNTAGSIGKYLGFRLPGSRKLISGAKNLYWGDESSTGRGPDVPVPYDTRNALNNIISGAVLANDSRSIVRRGECITLLPRDYGCRSAAGKWELLVKNSNAVPTPPALPITTELKSWSIHFNGIPEKAYLPAPVELIRGWYGGKGLPNATFDELYVPNGWRFASPGGTGTVIKVQGVPDPEILYKNVIAPSCRACHIQRGSIKDNNLDFATYEKFMKFKDKIKNLVFDRGLMPLAKRTYQNHFWKFGSGQPEELAKHILPQNIPLLKPGRNIANAGLPRTGAYAIRLSSIDNPGSLTTVNLNGRGSLFNNKYLWSVTTSNGAPVQVTGATTATPSFKVAGADIYNVTLDTSENSNSPATSLTNTTIQVEVSSVAPAPVIYSKDLMSNFTTGNPTYSGALYTCSGFTSCHNPHKNETTRPRTKILFAEEYTVGTIPFPSAKINEAYRLVRDRVDIFLPNNSRVILKALGKINHAGTNRRGVTIPVPVWTTNSPEYITLKRWILEGAINDLAP